MKRTLNEILSTYEYTGIESFLQSLFPSLKFDVSKTLLLMGMAITSIQNVLGVDFMAIAALVVMMVLELLTGIIASTKRAEEITSKKLSRFGIKTACYLVLMSVPYLFAISYENRGNTMASGLFNWIHVFLVVHIVQEHLLSLLENLASIQGKDKTYWINKIKTKINQIFES